MVDGRVTRGGKCGGQYTNGENRFSPSYVFREAHFLESFGSESLTNKLNLAMKKLNYFYSWTMFFPVIAVKAIKIHAGTACYQFNSCFDIYVKISTIETINKMPNMRCLLMFTQYPNKVTNKPYSE